MFWPGFFVLRLYVLAPVCNERLNMVWRLYRLLRYKRKPRLRTRCKRARVGNHLLVQNKKCHCERSAAIS
jgi:hypothetical protein